MTSATAVPRWPGPDRRWPSSAGRRADPPRRAGAAAARRRCTARAEPGRFTTLPDFAIERVVPAGKTDSYVVITFDSQGRLVVSKELDHPRLLLDADRTASSSGEGRLSTRSGTARASGSTGRRSTARARPVDAPAAGTAAAAAPRSPASTRWRTPTATMSPTRSRTLIAPFVGGIQEHGAARASAAVRTAS